jgi:excisionase family DNA binding protein
MIILQLDSEQLQTLVQDAIRKVITEQSPKTTIAPAPVNDLLNITEAADFLHLAKPTIYGLVSQSKIPCMKKGKKLYFSKAELMAWLQQGKRKTAAELQEEAESYLINKGKRG